MNRKTDRKKENAAIAAEEIEEFLLEQRDIPPAGVDIYAPVRQKGDAFRFKHRAADISIPVFCDGTVRLDDALPWNIIRAAAHGPADLTGCSRKAEAERDLAV